MANPFKKLAVQFPLKLFDLRGYGGLGKPKLFRRFCEAVQLRHLNEGYKVFQVHSTRSIEYFDSFYCDYQFYRLTVSVYTQ